MEGASDVNEKQNGIWFPPYTWNSSFIGGHGANKGRMHNASLGKGSQGGGSLLAAGTHAIQDPPESSAGPCILP